MILVLLLLAVAITARLRSPWLPSAATATATILFVDAWFDVLTSSTRSDLVVALIEAVFAELPFALLCIWLARNFQRGVERAAEAGDMAVAAVRVIRDGGDR